MEDHLPLIIVGILIAVVVGALAWLLSALNPTPSMYVRGYVPVESGERVVCVYDKKWVQTGKSGHYEHNLFCSEE